MPIEMTASELPKGAETDISTLLSADILALLATNPLRRSNLMEDRWI
jgi:hypothetical protein